LAGSVDDVAVVLLVLVPDRLVEDVFDGGVVGVDKGVFDVPDGERGFAWQERKRSVRAWPGLPRRLVLCEELLLLLGPDPSVRPNASV
jgi:hypothetical protein